MLEVQHMLNCFAGEISEIHDFLGYIKKKRGQSSYSRTDKKNNPYKVLWLCYSN